MSPNKIGGSVLLPRCPPPGMGGQGEVSAPGSSTVPWGDFGLSGSVGLREDGMGYEDRNGGWEWSRYQPGHNIPTPGTATCPQVPSPLHHQVCPKNIPMCPPRAKGPGMGWAVGDIGWEQPHAGITQHYLLLQKDFHKFPKPAGIVIPHGFGVAEGFQQRGRLQDLLW